MGTVKTQERLRQTKSSMLTGPRNRSMPLKTSGEVWSGGRSVKGKREA